MEKKTLTVLSFGGGQDSTAILYKIALDRSFRRKYIEGHLVVLMSDTGNEHPHTYGHIHFVKEFCKLHRIEFYLIDHKMGYHPKNWPTLQDQFRRYSTIMSVAFPKTCTDNLKIRPIYNFLDHYVACRYYGYSERHGPKGKRYLKRFCQQYGKINVLLGIAAGEESRIAKSNKKSLKKRQLDLFRKVRIPGRTWMDICIAKRYPLMELGMDRYGCQRYIRSVGLPLPFPSNCMMCPFASKAEILWLYRTHPDVFWEWVDCERRKLEKFADKGKRNLGVKGADTLETVLAQAIEEFGQMSDEELYNHKMTHGHCVMSTY